MSDMIRTGREPSMSGAHELASLATGQEPSLGGERLIKMYRQHLLDDLHKLAITHDRRASIGVLLNNLVDERPGVGLRADGLPDLVWCEVWQGEVTIRDVVFDKIEQFHVGRYYIAKYPVTWAQYRIFLEADDGHCDPSWWIGLRWRGEYPRSLEPIDNHPAQEVSWYDAVAYCRWLSYKLGFPVRLPTEWEWQQAAMGGNTENTYPWGYHWDARLANTRESKLRKPTAVGMYPHNRSPVGAMDMCGNSLEWCQNEYRVFDRTGVHCEQDWDGEDIARVLRGGSWFLVHNYSRTTFRSGKNPFQRFDSVGFRLAADKPDLSAGNLEHPVWEALEEDPFANRFMPIEDTLNGA